MNLTFCLNEAVKEMLILFCSKYICVCMHVCIYVYVCVYVYVRCMYVCIYIFCMCIYVYMLFPQSKNIIENINKIKLMVQSHHSISSNLY